MSTALNAKALRAMEKRGWDKSPTSSIKSEQN